MNGPALLSSTFHLQGGLGLPSSGDGFVDADVLRVGLVDHQHVPLAVKTVRHCGYENAEEKMSA